MILSGDSVSAGVGKDKHKKLFEFEKHWMLDESNLIVDHFEAGPRTQWLTRAYRNSNQYYVIASHITYDHYLTAVGIESGRFVIDDDNYCEEDRDYEGSVMTIHLPIFVVKALGGDSIDWLTEKLTQLRIDEGVLDDDFDLSLDDEI